MSTILHEEEYSSKRTSPFENSSNTHMVHFEKK